MKLAIHQPNFLPWQGYFHKMAIVDVFLIQDVVQFVTGEYDNRNRIKTPVGTQWLTVPVVRSKSGTLLKDILISNHSDWRHNHLKRLVNNYSRAPYFKDYFPLIREIYNRSWEKLVDFNMALLSLIRELLGIQTPLKFASELPVAGLKKTELIVVECRELGAETYLSGAGGRGYLDENLFKEEGITLEYQEYHPVEYRQRFGEFIPNLSVIDLLFNCGPESLSKILKKTERVDD